MGHLIKQVTTILPHSITKFAIKPLYNNFSQKSSDQSLLSTALHDLLWSYTLDILARKFEVSKVWVPIITEGTIFLVSNIALPLLYSITKNKLKGLKTTRDFIVWIVTVYPLPYHYSKLQVCKCAYPAMDSL